jgi:hypothetical protein
MPLPGGKTKRPHDGYYGSVMDRNMAALRNPPPSYAVKPAWNRQGEKRVSIKMEERMMARKTVFLLVFLAIVTINVFSQSRGTMEFYETMSENDFRDFAIYAMHSTYVNRGFIMVNSIPDRFINDITQSLGRYSNLNTGNVFIYYSTDNKRDEYNIAIRITNPRTLQWVYYAWRKVS